MVVTGRLDQRSRETDDHAFRPHIEIVAEDIEASLATVDIHKVIRPQTEDGPEEAPQVI